MQLAAACTCQPALPQAPYSGKPFQISGPAWPARQWGSLCMGCPFSGASCLVPAAPRWWGGWVGWGLPDRRDSQGTPLVGLGPCAIACFEAMSPGGVESWEPSRRGGTRPYFPVAAGPGTASCYSPLMVSSLPKGGEETASILGARKQHPPPPMALRSP